MSLAVSPPPGAVAYGAGESAVYRLSLLVDAIGGCATGAPSMTWLDETLDPCRRHDQISCYVMASGRSQIALPVFVFQMNMYLGTLQSPCTCSPLFLNVPAVDWSGECGFHCVSPALPLHALFSPPPPQRHAPLVISPSRGLYRPDPTLQRSVPSRPHPLRSVPSRPHPLRSVPSRPHPLRSVPSRPRPLRSVPSRSHPQRSVPSRPRPLRSVPSRSHLPWPTGGHLDLCTAPQTVCCV